MQAQSLDNLVGELSKITISNSNNMCSHLFSPFGLVLG